LWKFEIGKEETGINYCGKWRWLMHKGGECQEEEEMKRNL
jgi:hypothetical protein